MPTCACPFRSKSLVRCIFCVSIYRCFIILSLPKNSYSLLIHCSSIHVKFYGVSSNFSPLLVKSCRSLANLRQYRTIFLLFLSRSSFFFQCSVYFKVSSTVHLLHHMHYELCDFLIFFLLPNYSTLCISTFHYIDPYCLINLDMHV